MHIGTERDGVTIDGISVWDMRWIPTRTRITVEHPQWPNERHSMWTYRIDSSGRTVDFAAGEFSNGVWGFFVPDRLGEQGGA